MRDNPIQYAVITDDDGYEKLIKNPSIEQINLESTTMIYPSISEDLVKEVWWVDYNRNLVLDFPYSLSMTQYRSKHELRKKCFSEHILDNFTPQHLRA